MNGYYFVYILTHKKNGVLYIGVTSDLPKRIFEHKTNAFEGFSRSYNCKILVYFEPHTDINEAILREKRIKKWNRAWKIELIERTNPEWKDLFETIAG